MHEETKLHTSEKARGHGKQVVLVASPQKVQSLMLDDLLTNNQQCHVNQLLLSTLNLTLRCKAIRALTLLFALQGYS